MRVLILALGNELMKDDGAGLKAGRILAEKGYNVLEVGTDIFRLANHYNGEERIVIIDAILSDKLKPGEVVHFSGEEIFEKLKAEIRSAHFMGAIDGLKLLMALDERLKRAEIHFIGIVAKEIDLGMELSDEVKAGVQKAVEIAEKLAK
ncbi:hydrogenase-specific maturation endopeptidase [Thermococcus kodakarensis KOD1]|uniref:Hydrogenase-specific maturation endopeptidase n=1 Tax=Thermococcus kodakarensis (strain ATCC BAA-918 / JCM 12380 / KOD1) TaxID=69014 RepID=Q8NKS1_THEKO|nr:hydrogenase maturation protease [Thermococcus kodakarensis]5IJA_A Chain A, Hydrogenase-specific maturation endopeptidase [Thermococcus kodakarensis KOD1]5IJA_B Chain B, Hydrogenase-specific maturation endopeptidase [Thermococcus kodakarensis KOD1]WCN27926.1 hydrogenase maturation protease [Thermococcus kodakarensis]WCN30225.1 hydrogenase maturation protease [Thermococcus kodakarensis]BAC00532.1 hydrogenase-specific maturation endopeptidase [Thermococcus kodakarensis KOD1]BAD86255.1 hydroge